MNKQEAIERIEKLDEHYGISVGVYLEKIDVVNIISQIDEPQKVVVPKFVAEWIEEHKKSFLDSSAIDMYENLTLDNSNGYYHEVWLWVIDNHYDFIKAWHEGYEIEPEKLYTVEIPNPNMNAHVILQKTKNKVVLIVVNNARWKGFEGSKLTESEIKQDFAWAWDAGFAKEVE